jgi:hypothetical protein
MIISFLDEEVLLNQLKELVEKIGIEIRLKNLTMEEASSTGGLCRINEKYILFIHTGAPIRKKIQVMTEALRKIDLEDIYVKPAIRKLLDRK